MTKEWQAQDERSQNGDKREREVQSREAEAREAEAREVLDRLARDAETLGGSSLARIGRRAGHHFAGRDSEDAAAGGIDPIELWGRRIGRLLSALGFLGLAWWLGVQLGWWR